VIRTAIKFGGFVAVCLAFTLWLAFTIGNISFGKRYTLSAKFDDVTGLLPDDNVKVAGVVVGKVKQIKVDKGQARVTFSVDKDVRLPVDSSAAIRWRNLIGQRYLYLYPGTGRTVLLDGDTIRNTTSVIDLGQLFNRLGPIVSSIDPKEVNTFLDSVTQALNGNEDKVRGALDDLAVVAKGLGQRDQAIGRLVENVNTVAGAIVDRDAQIRTMLDNLVDISQTFSANTDVLNQAVTELGDFSANMSTILDGNRAEIDRLLTNLDAVVATVGGKLDKIDTTLAGLPAAVRAIFLSSRNGEFLNQAILCADTGPPPAGSGCKTPIVTGSPSGSAAPSSTGSAPTTTGSTLPVPKRGVDGLLSLFGGGQ
jgi:phospholipid/cholesterol/gamma-HCH transport system substrate-binding protein